MSAFRTVAPRVMIAGIGGASLGTELLKALVLAGGYEIFGCDVSAQAYGLHDPGFRKTYRVERDAYVESVLAACRDAGVRYLIPGGEQPMVLLGRAAAELAAAGIVLVCNSPEVIAVCSDKALTFRCLAEQGIRIPRTRSFQSRADADAVGLPCVVKPATGSGGSSMVFLAGDAAEATVYAEYVLRSGGAPILQEYIDAEEGEFSVGVLSVPDGRLVGSIALRRALDAKLSVSIRNRVGVISSGYSQGLIADFPEVRAQCETIARAVGSRGPLNVQARLRDGVAIPFEINPRFSASTCLRAMAGFNEADMLLQHLETGALPEPGPLRAGWYLRSLTERFVPALGDAA